MGCGVSTQNTTIRPTCPPIGCLGSLLKDTYNPQKQDIQHKMDARYLQMAKEVERSPPSTQRPLWTS